MTVTPGTRPEMICEASITGSASKSAAVIISMLLPTSFFRAPAAVPVTTISSREIAVAVRLKSAVNVCPSTTVTFCCVWPYPIRRATRMYSPGGTLRSR